MTLSNRRIQLLIVAVLFLAGASAATAGHHSARSSSRTSVNRNTHVNRNTNINHNRNTNVNVNSHRNVNIDVDVDHHHGCCYHDYHPVARATAVVATAAVIGSIVTSIPPSCTVVMVNGLTYQQCGSTWYQPQFVGTTTSYVVVAAPR